MKITPHHPSPSLTPPVRRPTLLVLGIDEAFRALRSDASVHVHAFTHDWGVLDRARALAAETGVSHRISFHHQGALASLRRAS